MNYRNFKNTPVAEVGLGTWQLGSADWGDIDEDKAFEILTAYTNAGGNFIDTADVYGLGVSEKVIGRFLKSVNTPVYVATKLGRRGDEPNGWPQNFSYDAMKRQAEDSLRHLDLDKLFLEQLHCIPTTEMAAGKVFDNLRKLQEEGLIRHFGASVETSEEALICLKQDGLASLQIIFNLFRQHVADEIFETAKSKNVAIIVRLPLASGLLSGKFNNNTTFSKNDHRNYNANGEKFNTGETFSGIEFKHGVELSKTIQGMLPAGEMAQWAIRWILDHPEVTTVIPGASKVSQVNSNVASASLPQIGEDLHKRLRTLYNEEIYNNIRGHF